ncbi:MAG: PorP/SprF family type IX secretion system membrane protein [Bacteroidales bacterium]|nr:PorP/SprF family type IX secretion system membrane protein [Bacteroidales bacterium]
MKKLIYLICLIFVFWDVNSQDYNMAQALDMHTYLNPANAGLNSNIMGGLAYRQQWNNISKPYRTAILDINGRVMTQGATGSVLGMGLVVVNDVAGVNELSTLSAQVAIMGKILLDEKQNISAGIIGGIMQRKIGGDLTWSDQYDDYGYNPNVPGDVLKTERRLVPDVGAGLQWSYGVGSSTLSSNDAIGAQVGLSFYHLNKPDVGFHEMNDERYIRGVLHGSVGIGVKNTPLQMNPQCLIQFQGPSRMYYTGAKVKYLLQEQSRYTGFLFSRSIGIGGYYRFKDAIVMLIQLEWDNFSFGISYDITVSDLSLKMGSQGSFEVNLKYIPGKATGANRLL